MPLKCILKMVYFIFYIFYHIKKKSIKKQINKSIENTSYNHDMQFRMVPPGMGGTYQSDSIPVYGLLVTGRTVL